MNKLEKLFKSIKDKIDNSDLKITYWDGEFDYEETQIEKSKLKIMLCNEIEEWYKNNR